MYIILFPILSNLDRLYCNRLCCVTMYCRMSHYAVLCHITCWNVISYSMIPWCITSLCMKKVYIVSFRLWYYVAMQKITVPCIMDAILCSFMFYGTILRYYVSCLTMLWYVVRFYTVVYYVSTYHNMLFRKTWYYMHFWYEDYCSVFRVYDITLRYCIVRFKM